jgi:hypothetical protein
MQGKSFWGRAATWIAAYAFVLQTVLAPVAAAAATQAAKAEAALQIVCAEHDQAAGQSLPAAPHEHDAACKFCVGCPATALLAPDGFVTAVVDLAISGVRWHPISHIVVDKNWLAGKQARGPPSLT